MLGRTESSGYNGPTKSIHWGPDAIALMDNEPEKVELEDQGIRITWKDGHRSIYSHRVLRLKCPCAQCVDEMTHELRLDPDTVPMDVRAEDHLVVGNYALQFLWSDVHYTGIYTYEFLRSNCTCMECLAARD